MPSSCTRTTCQQVAVPSGSRQQSVHIYVERTQAKALHIKALQLAARLQCLLNFLRFSVVVGEAGVLCRPLTLFDFGRLQNPMPESSPDQSKLPPLGADPARASAQLRALLKPGCGWPP